MSAPDRACPDYPNECVHPWAHARTYAEVKATQTKASIVTDQTVDTLMRLIDRHAAHVATAEIHAAADNHRAMTREMHKADDLRGRIRIELDRLYAGVQP